MGWSVNTISDVDKRTQIERTQSNENHSNAPFAEYSYGLTAWILLVIQSFSTVEQ